MLMESKIFNYFGLRDKLTKIVFFRDLLHCPLCTGFWTGVLFGIIGPFDPIVFPFYSSACCYFLYLVNSRLLVPPDPPAGIQNASWNVTLNQEDS